MMISFRKFPNQVVVVVVASALITMHFDVRLLVDNYQQQQQQQSQESRRVSLSTRDFVIPKRIQDAEGKLKLDSPALQLDEEDEEDHHPREPPVVTNLPRSAEQDEKLTKQQLQAFNNVLKNVARVGDFKFHWAHKKALDDETVVALDTTHRHDRLLDEQDETEGAENAMKHALQKSPTDSTVQNLLQSQNRKNLDTEQSEDAPQRNSPFDTTRTLHTCTFADASGNSQNDTFPVTPHLIIAGVAKAGTTALVSLLRHHPMLKKSRGEAHFFDQNPYLQQNLHRLDDEQVLCKIQRQYADKWNWAENDVGKLFYEKTPRYVILPDVPEVIRKVCPWKPKIIVMLRDPIARLESHHKMNLERKRGTAGLSLDQAIENEVAVLRELGLTTAPLLSELSERIVPDSSHSSLTELASLFDIPPLSTEDRKRISRILYKDVIKSHDTIMERGMYAAQLEPWLENFKIGESLLVIQHERLKSDPVVIFNEVQDFLEVPRHNMSKSVFKKDYSPNKGSFREVVSNTTLRYLRNFYHPYNEQLADLLGEEWRGIWKS